jgi:hypothetical protein
MKKSDLTPDQLYELQERAAILEYDGGLDRDEAWKRATNEQEEMFR